MRVTFWGTRGSCPTFPAPWEVQEYSGRLSLETVRAVSAYLAEQLEKGVSLEELRELLQGAPEKLADELTIDELPIFGGETTCVEVETSEGNRFIFDWGSGIRHCASKIMRERGDTRLKQLYLFGSHEHLDHRIGLSFAGFCFADPPFDIQVFGNSGVLRALDEHFGFFSHTVSESTYLDDPIDYRVATASFRGFEIRTLDGEQAEKTDGLWEVWDIAEPIRIGSTVVKPFQVYHGLTGCLGYKIEHGGKSFVFCTDHEKLSEEVASESGVESGELLRSIRADEEIGRMCQGVDLAYFDGQYTRDEYRGRRNIDAKPPVPRVSWGHGCIEDIIDRVRDTGIRRALIGHHDPERSWPAQLAMNERLLGFSAGQGFQIELARDGQVIEL